MWKNFLRLAAISLMIMSGSAFADSFYFVSAGNVIWNGVYVNPYQAIDNTQTGENPLTVYCDDWNTDFSGNPTWNADVYTLTADNLSHFKYANPSSDYTLALNSGNLVATLETNTPAWSPLQRYLEAAWLDEQWRDIIGTSAATTDTQIELAAAMWTLFVDTGHVDGLVGAINSTGYATAVNGYLRQAEHAVTSVEQGGLGYVAAGWDVIVPVGNSFPMQEFLVHAPEPSAMILLGTVIGYLGLTRYRRKRQA
jgi:hypothetical protein